MNNKIVKVVIPVDFLGNWYGVIENIENSLHYITDIWIHHNFPLDALRKVVFSEKINKFLPIKKTFVAKSLLKDSVMFDGDANSIYVYSSLALMYLANRYSYNKIASKNNSLIYLWDSVRGIKQGYNAYYKNYPDDFLITNRTITFSNYDAKKYNLPYILHPISPSDFERNTIAETPVSKDFALLQGLFDDDKSRQKYTDRLLGAINSFIDKGDDDGENNGDSSKPMNEPKNEPAYNFNTANLKYSKVNNYHSTKFSNNFIARCAEVNCCINFCQHSSDYLSITVNEAIYFNRKILTDASCVKKLKSYDPRWIKVLDSPDDITPDVIEWMMKRENVKYKHHEELLPNAFADGIREIFDKLQVTT